MLPLLLGGSAPRVAPCLATTPGVATAASPIAIGSLGAVGSAAGASSNVSSDSTSAASATPATIQNSGRQA